MVDREFDRIFDLRDSRGSNEVLAVSPAFAVESQGVDGLLELPVVFQERPQIPVAIRSVKVTEGKGVVKITVQGIARQHDSTTDKIVPTPKEKIIENNSSGKKEEPELVSTIVDSPNPNQEYLRESKLASAVDDILLGFGMDSEKGEDRASVTSMYRSFPHRLVTDAYLVTKDRMYRAASGQEPPLDSPIAYMWTVLRGGRTDVE